MSDEQEQDSWLEFVLAMLLYASGIAGLLLFANILHTFYKWVM